MDSEFSEFANALLALRMGKPQNPPGYTTDDQADNDTTGSEDDRLYKYRGLASSIMAVPSSSWTAQDFAAASYDFMDHPQKQSRKRFHHATVGATSSESNDGYDMDNMRGIVLEKKMSSKSSAGADKKLARGRYRCSLCGAFKTNHVCALVADKLMCSVGTQSYNSSSALSLVSQPPQNEDSQGSSTASTVQGALSPGGSHSTAPVDYVLTVSSGSASYKANPFLPSAVAAADGTGSFQERIVTVSRNRRSIQNPVPVPEEDVTVIMTTSDASYDSSNGHMLKLRKPSVASVSEEPALTSSAASSPSRAVTPNSPYTFASKLEALGSYPAPAPAPLPSHSGLSMSMPSMPMSMSMSMSMSMHPMHSLLSAPMQPMSMAGLPSFPSVADARFSTARLQPAPAPAPAKAVPNLIYPSALDLLGHAIYE